jgi:hypothetical protein
MKTSQRADKSPLVQTELMSWDELIDRLIAIQKARNYAPQWVVDRIEETGHPPKHIWRAIAKTLGYSQYWADWRCYPHMATDEPDPTAIDWVWDLPDVTLTNYNDIPCDNPTRSKPPKPLLRNNLRTDK